MIAEHVQDLNLLDLLDRLTKREDLRLSPSDALKHVWLDIQDKGMEKGPEEIKVHTDTSFSSSSSVSGESPNSQNSQQNKKTSRRDTVIKLEIKS